MKQIASMGLALSLCAAVGRSGTALAYTTEDATIDCSKTASLTITKYDLTAATQAGVSTSGLVSTGKENTEAETMLQDYTLGGVEFTYLPLGGIDMYSDQDATNATIFDNIIDVSDYRIEIGAQYTIPINKKNRLTLGAVYIPGKNLLGKGYISGGNYNTSSGNTTYFQNDTVSLKNGYSLPAQYGAGLNYTYDERLSVNADFTFQPWSKAKFENSTNYFNDAFQAAVGAEFLPQIYSNNFFQSIRYRAGVSVGRSYPRIKSSNGDNSLWETQVTIGAGIPMKRNKSIINFTFGYTNRRTTPTRLVGENEIRISLGLTFNEMWFYKSRLH